VLNQPVHSCRFFEQVIREKLRSRPRKEVPLIFNRRIPRGGRTHWRWPFVAHREDIYAPPINSRRRTCSAKCGPMASVLRSYFSRALLSGAKIAFRLKDGE
jgi:hypothetical protein